MAKDITKVISDSSSELERYLYNRGIEITGRQKPLEISEDAELLNAVAGAWTSDKEAIQAVVRARIDVLREKLICTALPQEVVVLRNAMVELAGILEDFENIHAEFSEREKNKPEAESDQPKEGD